MRKNIAGKTTKMNVAEMKGQKRTTATESPSQKARKYYFTVE